MRMQRVYFVVLKAPVRNLHVHLNPSWSNYTAIILVTNRLINLINCLYINTTFSLLPPFIYCIISFTFLLFCLSSILLDIVTIASIFRFILGPVFPPYEAGEPCSRCIHPSTCSGRVCKGYSRPMCCKLHSFVYKFACNI